MQVFCKCVASFEIDAKVFSSYADKNGLDDEKLESLITDKKFQITFK